MDIQKYGKYLVILGIVALAATWYMLSTRPTITSTNDSSDNIQSNSDSVDVANNNEVMESEVKGVYENYSEARLKDGETNILFFHASWCPSCKALDSDLIKNRANIPAKTNILKIDFDEETALRKKYSVTVQHTLVLVDGSGNLIRKINGLYSLPTLNSVLEKTK